MPMTFRKLSCEPFGGGAESWGFRNIQTRVLGPASEPDSFEALSGFDQQADIVLVDAPCSGWGVLRRNLTSNGVSVLRIWVNCRLFN
jgi:hypothetical protein